MGRLLKDKRHWLEKAAMAQTLSSGHNRGFPQLNSGKAAELYIDSFYFSTTTMTTVGYGDRSATGNSTEMIYCTFMIFTSMALFALVRSRVFSIKV